MIVYALAFISFTNKDIFKTLSYAALDASCELAEQHGPYPSYAGSPTSKGILQPDMWGVEPSERWDWRALRSRIAQHGLRNSLLLAPMPTASTAQILGNNECFEPYTRYTDRLALSPITYCVTSSSHLGITDDVIFLLASYHLSIH